jgi:hypothetical protein
MQNGHTVIENPERQRSLTEKSYTSSNRCGYILNRGEAK